MAESYVFDKFMEDIVRREDEKRAEQKKYTEEYTDTPGRRYAQRYRELPQNRIKWIKREG
jgi:hypothetical protein